MIKITFPDGKSKKFSKGTTALEIASNISEGLAREVVAASVNGKLVDATMPLTEDSSLKLIKFQDPQGKEVFRHTSAHLLAQAVTRLFSDALPTIGPVVEEGFYYDFDLEHKFAPEDLERIEQEMKKIVKENHTITKIELERNEAKKIFSNNKYKLELINELSKDEIVTAYKQGNFIDLCRGPHLPRTGLIKAFELTKVSGAYWKGDAKNKQLQRIYGISFPEKTQLKKHLELEEEAKKRDHRIIGKQLDFFSFHDEAPGMPFFHNKGTFIWNKLVEYTTSLMVKRNYEFVKTPIILNKTLWIQSGHWDHYKENMYFTKIDDKDFAVKPMNCPGHMLIYNNKSYSYRDLPLKMGEFGLVHRHELSGVLSGLFRVRCFTQDDAHIYCTRDQIEDQIEELLGFVDELYTTFGFDYHLELSTKPEKAMGNPKLWVLAEKKLKNVLEKSNRTFKINEGDGAFYGPKIDVHLKDVIGRTWQCGTIQLDFQMPEKFDLTYEGSDGKKHQPVMIHRAILGSVERFMGILIEHYAGKFPLWISPVQVRIMTISDRFDDYAKKLNEILLGEGFRSELDLRSESVNKKVRDAQIKKLPLMITIGDKEVSNNTISLRTRDGNVIFGIKTDNFIKQLSLIVSEKSEKLNFKK